MSIVTSFTICQKSNCSSLVFNDTTGPYSSDNTYGYNSPNESIIGATSELQVKLGNGSIVTVVLTDFPTTDKTKEFTITGLTLGYSTGIIPDQIIEFTYTITTALSTIITQVGNQGFYCNANCCVKSMFLDIDLDCEDCMKFKYDTLIKASLMLDGLKYSANCGDTITFNKTLTQLNKICSNSECSNCK